MSNNALLSHSFMLRNGDSIDIHRENKVAVHTLNCNSSFYNLT